MRDFLQLVNRRLCIRRYIRVFAFWGPLHFHILDQIEEMGTDQEAWALYVAEIWKSPSSVCCQANLSSPLSLLGGGCSKIFILILSGIYSKACGESVANVDYRIALENKPELYKFFPKVRA
ncbi:hypothetical protein PIB30_081471 [Stylosanthes scabra]|uniref:Uncharacterized protein n=1 Tax=Stylosanthes scabra TaxID=79078 RepID=A0ABU6UQH9_9FABA|nr:hypothetical protein [Stylosanthes scabra]